MAQPTPPLAPPSTPPTPRIVPASPRSRFSVQDMNKRKNQGIIGQISTVVFQPRLFFFTLPQTRQWLLLAMFALLLTGYSAIRKAEMDVANGTDSTIFQPDISFDGSGEGVPFPSDGGDPFSVPIPDSGGGSLDGGAGGTDSDINSQLSIAVTSGAWIVIAWMVQAFLLGLVAIFNMRIPDWGKNIQVAVWASLPLVMMSLIQLVFRSAGGRGAGAGLSSITQMWSDFMILPAEQQLLLYSALTQITLFSLWNLSLLYTGAREALNGKRLPSLIVVVSWIFIAVAMPILLGRITLPMSGGLPQ